MSPRAARSLLKLRDLAPLAILLCLTLPLLGQGAFRTDTGRYAAIGLHAWRSHDLLTLHIANQPYFNKPPLAILVHGLVLHAAGLSLALARLPTILAAAIVLVATHAAARRLVPHRAAALAAMVLALTYEFFRRTREISLDMWQTALLACALYLAARALRANNPRTLILVGIPVGLALLVKPFVAILALPIIAIALAWAGMPLRRSTPPLALAAAVAGAIAAPWHLAMVDIHRDAFVSQYLGAEILSRAAGENIQSHTARPWHFYLLQLLRTHWPWLPCLVASILTIARAGSLSSRRSLERVALVWTLAWLLLLSAFADRADRYALVLWPATSTLSALWLASRTGPRLRRALRLAPLAGACVAIPTAIAVQMLTPPVQAGPDPAWDTLVRALDDTGSAQIYIAGYDDETASYLYLTRGSWPTMTHNPRGERLNPPTRGDWIVYHERGGLDPGPGERTTVVSDSLRMSRLDAETWEPLWRARDR